LDIELGQLVAPEGAADQKRQDHVVAFSFEREVGDDLPVDILLYTTSVVNTPSGVRNDIIWLAKE
jgi:hypothetical protein